MRVQSLTLVAASAALVAPTTSPPVVRTHEVARTHEAVRPHEAARTHEPAAAAREGTVLAADLLAKVRDCAPVSNGRYRSDDGAPADIAVCGRPDAVFWKADMDIDCDGRPGLLCNASTDPSFSDATAFQQSDGRQLSAETLPYIVVPTAGDIWDHREHGVRGGAVAAVIYQDRVQYAVVGDTGPHDIIGEASYATARALGISPDPRGGGTDSGVTYIVFKNSVVSPIEDHVGAVAQGEALAREFLRGN
ncbi:glycoside hydrolase family 75 protein [Streptomyces avermitilis]|uniref:glycoside hydrolase family 75 protein n=1 Tax=Streptomyces avermitilis TaxID=33903 RepID=UPI0033BEA62A